MRDAALPAALVAASLGLALSSAPSLQVVLRSLILFAVAATTVAALPLPPLFTDAAFLACFLAVLTAAGAVIWPDRLAHYLAIAALAGASSGAAIAASGSVRVLEGCLPITLLVLPGRWLIGTDKSIALKVVASWLVAVSILAGTLIVAPITPGYAPDHIE